MGRKKSKKTKVDKEKKVEREGIFSSLRDETIDTVTAIIFILISIFLFLSSITKAGVVGDFVYKFGQKAFGIGYFLFPLILVLLSISFFRSIKHNIATPKIIGGILFVVAGLGLFDFINEGGGIIGHFIGIGLEKPFGMTMGIIIVLALIVISLLIVFDTPLRLQFWKKKEGEDEERDSESDEEFDSKIDKQVAEMEKEAEKDNQNGNSVQEKEIKQTSDDSNDGASNAGKKSGGLIFLAKRFKPESPFTPPPLSLLETDSGKPSVGDIKANANIIKRTLHNFGIDVEMDEVSIGPSVTRYALKPAEGVRLSRIVALQKDLSLALAAHPLRIEAPIPGKSLVGIEIPNEIKSKVGLGTLLASDDFQSSEKPLYISLGKGISGKSHFADLAKMPHVLIAGATGSGKSVTIHTVITSLLYRNSPDNLKFIMVDPKRVELTLYNKIPHLLTPVITDAKKAILALKWAAKEMERRYDILERNQVRDISSYHKNILEPSLKNAKGKSEDEMPETMPYVVFIIDELADIMQAYPRELEAGIVRLAQMSRAVGIHLILSTQRPSVNVITGLIKANVPGRVALQVASQVDSRTILDMSGAEKLLGAGDMLYLSGEMSQPTRIQSAFISEEEVKKVVKNLASQYEDELPESDIDLSGETERNDIFDAVGGDDADAEDEDPLFGEAKEAVIAAGKASTSYLQRKLRVGYSRAARLIDLLEEKGIVGPADGSKPRDILAGSEAVMNDDSTENNEGNEMSSIDESNNDSKEDDEESYY